ncbi:MAG: methyltransferase domain-containing protein [Vicinamibacterales bacterium]
MPSPPLVQRVEFVTAICRGRSVLHLGCTNHPYTAEALRSGTLLHSQIQAVASRVVGFDADAGGLETLRQLGVTDLHRADLERLDAVDVAETFDVVVAGEIVEHLANPGLFLAGVRRFMHPASRLVVTTVNAYCGLRFVLYALRGRGGTREPVHPDHVAYYSYATLGLLLRRHGFHVDECAFYDLGREHRPHNPWYYNLTNDVLVTLSRQLADGLVAVCSLPREP